MNIEFIRNFFVHCCIKGKNKKNLKKKKIGKKILMGVSI